MKDNIAWIDRVKIFACISVVVSHLINGIVEANIIKPVFLTNWIEFYLYLFHVPLFFICSGYLYQKYSSVTNIFELKQNIIKKFINLSIPYFVFTIITFLLKLIFNGSVNNVETDLLKILFITPTAPYWYLYIIFFFFAITLTISTTKQEYIILIIAFTMKIIASILFDIGVPLLKIDLIEKFMFFYIWFVIGMVIANNKFIENFLNKINIYNGIALVLFITLYTIILFYKNYIYEFVRFLLGLLLSLSICSVLMKFRFGKFEKMIKYIMPIFLMHTIFAAGIRSFLLYLNIYNIIIHIVCGFIASVILPIIVANILEKTIYLNIVLYPLKTIKTIKKVDKRRIYEYKKNNA